MRMMAQAMHSHSQCVDELLPSCSQPTERDRSCVENRQLRHPLTSMLAVGARCKYGFPQAVVLDPCRRAKSGLAGFPIDTGLFRLTCPHLVQAIDEWEREGAVRELNARVDAAPALQASLNEAHDAHRTVRRGLVGEQQCATFDADQQTSVVLNSGLAGVTRREPPDAKCLHAQVADVLCRGEKNAVGLAVLDGLRARGVDPSGGCRCWQQCDETHAPTADSWEYTPQKNKQRLRTTIARRKALRKASRARTVDIRRP